jgi:hypothetical protein
MSGRIMNNRKKNAEEGFSDKNRKSGVSVKTRSAYKTKLSLMSQGRLKKSQPVKGNYGYNSKNEKRVKPTLPIIKERGYIKPKKKEPEMVNAFYEGPEGSDNLDRRYRKKRTNVMVPKLDNDNRRDIINKQLAKKGMLKDLGGTAKRVMTVEQTLPQVSTINITAHLDVQNFVDVCYQWALFLLSKKIGNNLTVSTPFGDVGQLYILACVVGYDLYQACNGSYTSFSMINMQYLELFRAATIKERKNRKYNWDIPTDQPFFGTGGFLSLIPGNVSGTFPLYNPRTFVSLSWPVSNGPNLTLSSTPPAFTDQFIVSDCYSIAMNLFGQLATVDGNFKMVSVGTPTKYDKSVGIFASCSPLNSGVIRNDNFCAFTNEIVIYPHEFWLCQLGWSFSLLPNPGRAGSFAYNEYQMAGAYGWRLFAGYIGKRKPVRIRIKYIYLEDIIASALAEFIQADLFRNNQEGILNIDQVTFINTSVMAAMNSSDFLAGICCVPVDRFWATTFLTADQTRTEDYPICGMKYYTEQIVSSVHHPQNLVEGYASSYPFFIDKGGWQEGICAALVTRGAQYANIFESNGSGDPDSLRSFVGAMYPNSNVASFSFNPVNSTGMTDILDPENVSMSQFLGLAISDVIVQFNAIMESIQANIDTVVGNANINLDNTVLHYSKLGFLTQQTKKRIKSKFEFDDEDEMSDDDNNVEVPKMKKLMKKAPTVHFTDYLNIELSGISNRIAFSPNMVSDDMSKVLPLSLVDNVVYQGIFNECVSLVMDVYSENNPTSLVLMSAMAFVHHYAGAGDEANRINEVKIEQKAGGGFFGTLLSSVGNVIQSLPI